jgi:hypothetical protein
MRNRIDPGRYELDAFRTSLSCKGSIEEHRVWSHDLASTTFWYAKEFYKDSICVGTVEGTMFGYSGVSGMNMRTRIWGMKGGKDTSLLYSRSVGGTDRNGNIVFGNTIRNLFIANTSDPYIQVCVAYTNHGVLTSPTVDIQPTCFTLTGGDSV